MAPTLLAGRSERLAWREAGHPGRLVGLEVQGIDVAVLAEIGPAAVEVCAIPLGDLEAELAVLRYLPAR